MLLCNTDDQVTCNYDDIIASLIFHNLSRKSFFPASSSTNSMEVTMSHSINSYQNNTLQFHFYEDKPVLTPFDISQRWEV